MTVAAVADGEETLFGAIRADTGVADLPFLCGPVQATSVRE